MVNYEGRRFGVPYSYGRKTCRIQRDGFEIRIYDDNLTRVLARYDVTWSRKDQFCKDQYAIEEPEEQPTAEVKTVIQQITSRELATGFARFNFMEGLKDE